MATDTRRISSTQRLPRSPRVSTISTSSEIPEQYLGYAKELELDRGADSRPGTGHLLKEALRWLIFGLRPLSLVELQLILNFGTKHDGLRLKCPSDMFSFLSDALPTIIEIRNMPAVVPTSALDGSLQWSTKQLQHATIRKDAKRWLRQLPKTHYFCFQERDGNVKLAEVCLQYLSCIEGLDDLSEPKRLKKCAEHGFLHYATNSVAEHASRTSRPLLRCFASSKLFQSSSVSGFVPTLLPTAARKGDYTMVAMLVDTLNPNARESGPQSCTALTYAAKRGDLQMVDMLLSLPSIEVDLKTFGDMTPLLSAIQCENLDVARLLMAKGRADPAICESHGWNALRMLFRTSGSKSNLEVDDHHDQVLQTIDQIFLVLGAEGRAQITDKDLEVATQNGNFSAIEYMMKRYNPSVAASASSADRKSTQDLECEETRLSDKDRRPRGDSRIRLRHKKGAHSSEHNCLMM